MHRADFSKGSLLMGSLLYYTVQDEASCHKKSFSLLQADIALDSSQDFILHTFLMHIQLINDDTFRLHEVCLLETMIKPGGCN
jgi:hypothetical protein